MKTRITTSAYHEMLTTVGSQKAESGGLLFGSRRDWVITKFLFDKDAHTTASTYTFNVGYLNPMIEKLRNEQGLELLGFFHSHPQGYKQLSGPDKEYFMRQFNNIKVDKFLVPLMFPATDGTYDFRPYIIYRDGCIQESELDIMPDDYARYVVSNIEVDSPELVVPTNRRPSLFLYYLLVLLCISLTGTVAFALGILYKTYYHFE